MYIRYLGNIHNLSNFYSYLRSNDTLKGAGADTCINLMKHDGNHISLLFKTKSARDFILNEIWKEIEKESKCYDIDAVIEAVYAQDKYNL